MKLDLTTRRVSETKIRLADIVSSGEHFKSRYLDIAKRTNEAIPANLPGWARQYLRGYADAMLDRLQRQTDFRYLIGNEWINARDLQYDNDCRDPRACSHSGHIAAHHNPPQATFWKDSDRIFYQSVDHIYGKVETPA